MNIVICGGGVIGASVAYFLAERGVAATLVEREDIACAASGKSGGFIARDWCDGQPQAELARASFDLHAELARTLDADYGYRRIDTLLVAGGDRGGFERYRGMDSPEWLDGRCAVHSAIGSIRTTATIHPERFTRALVDAACARGARLVHGAVDGIARDARSAVRGVRVDGAEIDADAVVIAMGPWSILAAQWLPLPPVVGLKGYSVVLAPRVPLPAQALFVEYESAAGERTSPEIVARAHGEVWACGLSSDDPLPTDPAAVTVDEVKCREIARICAALSSRLDGADVLRAQACYRPICADAMPLLGAVPDVPGAYVATGHNCWGMLNAPASGRAMAELLCDGASSSVDLAPFDPARLEAEPGTADSGAERGDRHERHPVGPAVAVTDSNDDRERSRRAGSLGVHPFPKLEQVPHPFLHRPLAPSLISTPIHAPAAVSTMSSISRPVLSRSWYTSASWARAWTRRSRKASDSKRSPNDSRSESVLG